MSDDKGKHLVAVVDELRSRGVGFRVLAGAEMTGTWKTLRPQQMAPPGLFMLWGSEVGLPFPFPTATYAIIMWR